MANTEAGLSLEDLLLFPPSQQLYVLDRQVADRGGAAEALCAVLLKRDHGFLLGVPRGLLADSEISAGFVAPMEALLGPSTVVECPAAILQAGTLTAAPGRVVSVTLLDVSAELSQSLVPFEAGALRVLVSFDPASPGPCLDSRPECRGTGPRDFLLCRRGPPGRCCKEAPPSILHLSRADMAAPAPSPGTTAAEAVQKPKKPSVPSARVDGMDQRTQEIANLVTTPAAAPLRRPLSDGLGASAKAQPPALARLGPPPSARAPPQRPQTETAAEDGGRGLLPSGPHLRRPDVRKVRACKGPRGTACCQSGAGLSGWGPD